MRIKADASIVLVVDVQERLFVHIHAHEALASRMAVLLQGVALFDVPIVLNEQYPKGLGHTIPALKALMPESMAHEKQSFSCCQTHSVREILGTKKQAIVFGVESHVCVLQTCLDLLAMGMQTFLVVDACGSRNPSDHETAVLRLVQAGVIPTTVESLLFELCGSAAHPQFKAMSQLVK